jgi:hypothetical protein
MEHCLALLAVVFQLFFGWCGEDSRAPPPAPVPCEDSAGC